MTTKIIISGMIILIMVMGLVLSNKVFGSTHPGHEYSIIGGWNTGTMDADADFYNSDGYGHGYDPSCP